jgi:acetylornithine deacetylase/succinyl-diaminopimelate desuccinylase-like protein
MAQLMAIEAYLKTVGKLPINLKLFYEGQEEIGSPDIRSFIKDNTELLKADAAVITDTGWIDADTPSITCGLRGLAGFEVIFTGPDHDLHSGEQGGVVRNPINALAGLVASFHDAHGHVAIDGFYDDVLPLSPQQRLAWQKLPRDDDSQQATGVDCLSGGEVDSGFSPIERRWGRPTLDCNGIGGGYTGSGSKTIIPSTASVKFTCRLVANQNPQRIVELVQAHIANHTPPGIKASIAVMSANPPFIVDTDLPSIQAAQAALVEITAKEVAFIRAGGSIAVAEQFQTVLGLKPVLMGFNLPGCNMHGPNESWPLEQFKIAARTLASFMDNLAKMPPAKGTSAK